MDYLFTLLGAVDLLAAVLLFTPFSDALMLYVAVYMLAKGGFFFLTGAASKTMGVFCTALCVIDILTGVMLGATAMGYVVPLLGLLRYVSLTKGFYCFVAPMFS
ncbi:MAG: hypothetical protein NT016_00435 [Candidatus Aenigmarchaeota archaeon]|nr:hypothetical protein [Candidatus Aenigmarchaeota archaeon]